MEHLHGGRSSLFETTSGGHLTKRLRGYQSLGADRVNALRSPDTLHQDGVLCVSSAGADSLRSLSSVTGDFGVRDGASHIDEEGEPFVESFTSTLPSFASDISLLENAHVLAKVDQCDLEKAAGKDDKDDDEEKFPHVAFVEGGYQAEFATAVEENLKCAICLLVLRDATQTPCGHRFCQCCIAPVLKGPKPRCPVDRKQLLAVFPDTHCQREVLELPVRCDNFKRCDWRGPLRQLERHMSTCAYVAVGCSNEGCGKRIERRRLQQHIDTDCSFRRASCPYCRSAMPYSTVEEHVRCSCPDFVEPCPNSACSASVTRATRQRHLEEDCDEVLKVCRLGCGQMVRKADVQAHLQAVEFSGHHVSAILATVSSLERQMAAKDDLIERQQSDIAQLQADIKGIVEKGSKTADARSGSPAGVSSVPGGVVNTDAMVEARPETVASLERDLATAAALVRIEDAQSKLETANVLALQQVDNQDLRLLALEKTSYNGTLVWRVDGFEKALKDAKDGVKVAHYSPPFYAGRFGYKLCVRLYPNGDGPGKGKYMSLFFVVMSGEYDSLNYWPFCRRVTMTLLDQSTSRRHISEQFQPDRQSSSFQRPQSGMNVASGCPSFVSHEMLRSPDRQYLKDDAFFLKISIDTSGLNLG